MCPTSCRCKRGRGPLSLQPHAARQRSQHWSRRATRICRLPWKMDAEMLAIRVLETAFRRLVVHGDYLDTTSDKGYQACQNFLQSVDKASDALGLRQASRAYRSTFSGVYRNLFDGEQRSYRVDILEAGTSGGSVIWANGEEFKGDRKDEGLSVREFVV